MISTVTFIANDEAKRHFQWCRDMQKKADISYLNRLKMWLKKEPDNLTLQALCELQEAKCAD